MDLAHMIVSAARDLDEKELVYKVMINIAADTEEKLSSEHLISKCKNYVKICAGETTFKIKACCNFEKLCRKVWMIILDHALTKARTHFNTNFVSMIAFSVYKQEKKIYSDTKKILNIGVYPESFVNSLVFISDPNLIVE